MIEIIGYAKGTNGAVHTLRRVGDQIVCSCPDYLHRSHGSAYCCKHVAALAAEVLAFVQGAAKSSSAERILAEAAE